MNNIRYLENSLLVNNEILVISDIHMGYEEYLFGKLVPVRVQLEETIKNFDKIFEKLDLDRIKIKEVVILGDLKHEFGEISDSEWRETIGLLDYLIKKCKEIILIRGNHDNIIEPILKKRKIIFKDFYKIGDILFLHGDTKIKEIADSKILILGHLHPAIILSDEYKKEKFKCFLKGNYKNKEAIIIPSFVPIVFGYDVFNIIKDEKEKGKKDFFIIPNKDLKNFEVLVYNDKDDKIHNFGKLKNIL